MAESAQVAKVSIKHDAILDVLVANPTLRRSEVAAMFGVTVPWLSTIIHSDVFQEKLRERQDLVFDVAVIRPIQDKLLGMANQTVERLMEAVQFESDPKTLNTILDTTLKNLGYGQKSVGAPVNQQNNFTFNVTKEELADARKLIGRGSQVPLEQVVTDAVYVPLLGQNPEEF